MAICAGMHLAWLEMTALVAALARHVRRFEIGDPVWAMNNTLRGLASLPVSAPFSTCPQSRDPVPHASVRSFVRDP